MKVADFDFELPAERIAQEPTERRDASRMMVLERDTGGVRHRHFSDLPDELEPGDLIVLNDTRVIPARLHGRKPTGGAVEVLLIEPLGRDAGAPEWRALMNGSRSMRPGLEIAMSHGLTIVPLSRETDTWRVKLSHPTGDIAGAIAAAGEVPLPPYIRRDAGDARWLADRERYQTIYARVPGAAAAPTAGLHVTQDVLARLKERGVVTAFVTLHVGPGTFSPIRTPDVEGHRMHEESYVVPEATAAAVRMTRARGGRVIAVGTTVARTLETCADDEGHVAAASGRSSLFIYPGFRFRVVDGLVTNFHLPQSTLLMLVCAFAGTKPVFAAYRQAVVERYRFFSYGDAMFVRPA